MLLLSPAQGSLGNLCFRRCIVKWMLEISTRNNLHTPPLSASKGREINFQHRIILLCFLTLGMVLNTLSKGSSETEVNLKQLPPNSLWSFLYSTVLIRLQWHLVDSKGFGARFKEIWKSRMLKSKRIKRKMIPKREQRIKATWNAVQSKVLCLFFHP